MTESEERKEASIADLRIEDVKPKRPGKKRVPGLRLALVLLLIGGAGLLLYRYIALKKASVDVYVVPASASDRAGGFTAGGYIEVIPPGPTVVSTLVEGRVGSLGVVEGQSVLRGQELARLDPALYQQEIAVRESAVGLAKKKLVRQQVGFRSEEIAQAKAELQRSQAKLGQAQIDYERNEALLKIGAVPKKVVLTAATDLADSRASKLVRQEELDLRVRGYRKEDIAIARAELDAAEAELGRARLKLAACIIRAPVSGVVLERFVQPGDWVAPTDRRERPGALLSVVDPRRIQAWIDVNQRDIGQVYTGQEAVLATDGQPNRRIQGQVLRILPKGNLQKNTVQVKVSIPNPASDLRPEMSVKVTFLPRQEKGEQDRVVVPSSAVVGSGEKAKVFLYMDGRVLSRDVSTRGGTGGTVEVMSGVKPGDQVVVDPRNLHDGDQVEIRKR